VRDVVDSLTQEGLIGEGEALNNIPGGAGRETGTNSKKERIHRTPDSETGGSTANVHPPRETHSSWQSPVVTSQVIEKGGGAFSRYITLIDAFRVYL